MRLGLVDIVAVGHLGEQSLLLRVEHHTELAGSLRFGHFLDPRAETGHRQARHDHHRCLR